MGSPIRTTGSRTRILPPAACCIWRCRRSRIISGVPQPGINPFPFPLHFQKTDMFRFCFIAVLFLSFSAAAQSRIVLDKHWKLCAEESISGDSSALLRPGYDARGWTDAVVPGTTFTSFVAAGKEADP